MIVVFSTANALKITEFEVPSTFIVNRTNPTSLFLTCKYEIDPKENSTGFLYKWKLNHNWVIQWYPAYPIAALVSETIEIILLITFLFS